MVAEAGVNLFVWKCVHESGRDVLQDVHVDGDAEVVIRDVSHGVPAAQRKQFIKISQQLPCKA